MRRTQWLAAWAGLWSLLWLSSTGLGGELIDISWPTEHAAPPAALPEGRRQLLPLIRLGVRAVPEANLMQLTVLGGSALGLPVDKATALHEALSQRYDEIAADPVFAVAPSMLPFCYSAAKPARGRATVVVPAGANRETGVIVFLHGYGGSFLFYAHYLAQTFPEHVVVLPAFGISCAQIPPSYIVECLARAEDELGFRLSRPVLIGLSAGGFGGFREYARRPAAYLGYICLAAFPPEDMLAHSPRGGRIRLLAGADESFVRNGALARAELRLRRRTAGYAAHLLPGEDHFFMLGSEGATQRILRGWVAEMGRGE